MSDENFIGHGACPVCGSVKARFTFSKKSLACITCNACQFQGFARSDNSDTRLRSMVKAAPVPAPEPTPTPAKAVPEPETKKPGFTWGMLTS